MSKTNTQFNPQDWTPSRRKVLATAALSAAGISIPSLLAACGSTPASSSGSGEGDFPSHPKWNFVFVNHVTTNVFFVPTQYGIKDACDLLGCTYQWTGSDKSVASDMVNAMDSAIAAKADGIAVSIVDPTAFNAPVENALNAGIPVVSYNADAPTSSGNKRMAYIGQDLFNSGVAVGNRFLSIVDSGDIVGFIATPGQLNIQPRIDGVKAAIQASGKPVTFTEIATDTDQNVAASKIESYYLGHKNIKGMIAVDATSTIGVGQLIQKSNLVGKVHGAGYDLPTLTLQAIQAGNLDFTVDQQPYLQGFLPVIALFLYKLSGGLVRPPETDTGLLFVTKDTVGPYLNTTTRFEGSSSKEQVVPAPK